MYDRPDVSNPFYSIYQVAEQLCSQIPPGSEIKEVCIVGTIGGHALAERARLERAEIFPVVVAITIGFGIISLWRRNRAA
jgi:hypothetical protein